MTDNLKIYNAVRAVPENAQKKITGGRLNGYTDINPLWRIKALTEQFGLCGIGWKYVITNKEIIEGANDEKSAFVDINLFIKVEGEWSDAIPGTGGSSFVTKEKNGLYTSDECFKMALTDAISVACKALGFGADVYWQADKTKYDRKTDNAQNGTQKPPSNPLDSEGGKSDISPKISEPQAKRLFAIANGKNDELKEIITSFGYSNSRDILKKDYEKICATIEELHKAGVA